MPESNKVWTFVCILEQLTDSLLSTSYTNSEIIEMEKQISNHNSLYVSLFNDNLKPKHHFLTHYCSIIRQSGPVRYLWCIISYTISISKHGK